MLEAVLKFWIPGGALVFLTLSCTKEDPRCPRIADNIAGIAVVGTGKATEEELAQRQAQAERQKSKLRHQCASALRNDTTGGVSLWMDCMVEARTKPQVEACRGVGTPPQY